MENLLEIEKVLLYSNQNNEMEIISELSIEKKEY